MATVSASRTITLYPTLFGSEAYQSLNGHPEFTIEQPGSSSGLLSFFRGDDPNALQLQHRAPFLQGALENCPPLELVDWLQGACVRYEATRIAFTLPPEISHLGEGIDALGQLPDALQLTAVSLNHHLDVGHVSFPSTLPGDQRRVLRKQAFEGLLARRAEFHELEAVVAVIAENRLRRSYPFTSSFESLRMAFTAVPECYRAYLAANREGELVGGAIVVRVRPEVWYTYLLGHGHGTVPGQSPILGMIDRIFEDAQAEGVPIIDLGTSGLPGQELPGLLAFKRSLGAVETSKRSYVYRRR